MHDEADDGKSQLLSVLLALNELELCVWVSILGGRSTDKLLAKVVREANSAELLQDGD